MRNSVKLLIGAALIGVGGLVLWSQTQPEPVVETVAKPAHEPAAEAMTQAPKPAPEPPTEPESAVVPQIDVVRVSPDGQAVIAGRAEPGQMVEILLDGLVIGSVEADAAGSFATVLDVSASSEARELTLRTALSEAPADVVALAPTVIAVEGEDTAAAEAIAEAAEASAIQAVAEIAADIAAAEMAATASTAEAAAAEAGVAVAAAEVAVAEAVAAPAAAAEAGVAVAAAEVAVAEAVAAPAAAAEAGVAVAAAEVAVAEAVAAPAAAAEAGVAVAAAEVAVAEAVAAPAAAAEAGVAVAAAEVAAAEAAAAPAAVDPAAGISEPEVTRFAVSTPILILPQEGAEQAPLLVKPEPDGVILLQPTAIDSVSGIVLDQITYSSTGDLLAAGRGQPGAIVRVYANAMFVEEIRCTEQGHWQVRISSEIASTALLLRFDEVDAAGEVLSRLETPFEYSPAATVLDLRARKIVVQKGDNLWTFAEQYYGEGIRYSVIFSANANLIRDADLIYPGQVFSVPELVDSQ